MNKKPNYTTYCFRVQIYQIWITHFDIDKSYQKRGPKWESHSSRISSILCSRYLPSFESYWVWHSSTRNVNILYQFTKLYDDTLSSLSRCTIEQPCHIQMFNILQFMTVVWFAISITEKKDTVYDIFVCLQSLQNNTVITFIRYEISWPN